MTKIIVDHGEKKQLAKLFSTSHVTVREALAGRTKSALVTKIRTAALARGGKETNN
jgi:DNA-binding GntR family transcriptional regulator